MARMLRRPSSAVQNFRTICQAHSVSTEVDRACIKSWCAEVGLPAKTVGRSIERFIAGYDKNVSTNVAPHFIRYCKDRLGIEIVHDDVSMSDRFRDHLGEFAKDTKHFSALLDDCVGDYVLFRPRHEDGRIAPIDFNDKNGLTRFCLSIRPEGSTGRFAFTAKVANDEAEWRGHAICSDRFIYLIGFTYGEHPGALFIILTPLRGNHAQGGVLVGTKLVRLSHSVDQRQHDAVAGRILALAKTGARQADRERTAKAWLKEKQESDEVGFVVNLVQSAVARSGAVPDQ